MDGLIPDLERITPKNALPTGESHIEAVKEVRHRHGV